ncbi:hypothetical protein Tco_0021993, partial [Tanacetum coccineum]
IEPTVTLFKVFQTLCKQGDWFSFAKRCAPSPVCIDDNRSCMKHWKSGFFFIDRRAIMDSMVWRHPNAAIDVLRPAAGSFSMDDVRRLSPHVIMLRDMPEGVLVLSGLSHVWKSRVCDLEEPHLDVGPTLQRLPFYCTPSAVADAVIPDPTPEDLAVVLLVPRFLLRLKLFRSERPLLLVPLRVIDDDDDDACVEIPLVTPIRSAAVIPSLGNQGGSFAAPAAKGPGTRDS